MSQRGCVVLDCEALLFDMDGTVLNSFSASDRVWAEWAERNGLGPAFTFHAALHGRQRPDIIAELRPDLTPAEVAEHAEQIRLAERDDVAGVLGITGAAELLSSLPPERWAVVTAADAEVARARIGAAGLPLPTVLVTADDLDRGKPDPQGYLLAARRLGVDPDRCVVFEDARAGLGAAAAAGMRAVALRTSTPEDQLAPALAVLDNLCPVRVDVTAAGSSMRISVNDQP